MCLSRPLLLRNYVFTYLQIAMLATAPKDLDLNPPAGPMLSRDADSMYWMARYVERAEHVARMLLVNSNLLMDVGDLAPTLQQRQWRSVLEVMRLGELPPSRDTLAGRIQLFMTFAADNPSSLLS